MAVRIVWGHSTLLERGFFFLALLIPAYVFFDRLHYRKAGLSGDFAVFTVIFVIVYLVALLGVLLATYREAKRKKQNTETKD